MSVATMEDVSPKVVQLCRSLKRGPTPLSKLDKVVSDESVLGEAFADGLIQIGLPEYTFVCTSGGEQGEAGKLMRKDGKPVIGEDGRQQLDKQYKVVLDGKNFSWLDAAQQHGRKPLLEILQESDQLPEGVEYHARLTTAGLKASR